MTADREPTLRLRARLRQVELLHKPVNLPKGLPVGEMRNVVFSKSGSLKRQFLMD